MATSKTVPQNRFPPSPDLAEIKRAISTLFKKNQTIEIRVLDSRKKVALSGYYRDSDKLGSDVFSIAKRRNISAIYWTLQECDPALYSRSANAYIEHPSSTTNDHDIQRFRWLLIDCDPQRPEGICATDEEKKAAYEVALKVRQYIRGFDVVDMSNSILADSGNGFHVLVPIDLENSSESKALIQQTLKALDQRFATEAVKIDTKVFNPSRICKIYGTVVRKGSDTNERPHRQARLIDMPLSLPTFSRENLETIAETATAEPTATSGNGNNLNGTDLEKRAAKVEQFLVEAKIDHRERMDYMGGFKWQLAVCPFNPDHAAPDSFVSVAGTGALGFHCSHNSCDKNKWREFREIAEEAIGHRFSFTDKIADQPAVLDSTPSANPAIETPLHADDAVDFVKETLPPRATLLNPFLAERTIGMVHAWRGVGKTHIMLGMATAEASGGQFLRWSAPEPSPVLYVDGEMADEDVQLWLKETMSCEGMPPIQHGMFHLVSADRQAYGIPSLSTHEGQRRIEDAIGNARTIYFDNISCLFRGGDEKEGTDWESAQEWLLSLRRKGISTVLGHHDGKQGFQRGTSKREDPMNWVIHLTHPKNYHPEEGLRCEVKFEKARRVHGVDARSFEARLEVRNGVPIWTVREMTEALADTIKQMKTEMGMSFGEIGKELRIAKSWAKTVYDKSVKAAESAASTTETEPAF